MSSVNVNVSVTNLPQFERHQNDIHKNPIVNQDQNAKIAQNELDRKMKMPVEAEHTEGKLIDPNQKREEKKKNKKKRIPSDKRVDNKELNRGDGGYIVDIEA